MIYMPLILTFSDPNSLSPEKNRGQIWVQTPLFSWLRFGSGEVSIFQQANMPDLCVYMEPSARVFDF